MNEFYRDGAKNRRFVLERGGGTAKKLIKNGGPVAVAAYVAVLLATGAAVAHIGLAILFLIGLLFLCNPLELLSVVLAEKARLCMGMGIILFFAAFACPICLAVTAWFCILACGLFLFGATLNGRMMRVQKEPMQEMNMELLHSSHVDRAIASMCADDEHLDAARKMWAGGAIKELRAMALKMGVCVTEEEIRRVGEIAFVLGNTKAQAMLVRALDRKEQEFSMQLRGKEEEILSYQETIQGLQNKIYQTEQAVERMERRAWEAEDFAFDLDQKLQKERADELTGEKILELVKSGMTQNQIAAEYGLDKSTISKRKKKAEEAAAERIRMLSQYQSWRPEE